MMPSAVPSFSASTTCTSVSSRDSDKRGEIEEGSITTITTSPEPSDPATDMTERHTQPRELLEDFEPDENHVVIGRGKKTQEHSGNKRLCELIQAELVNFVQAQSKTEKTYIISRILHQVKAWSKNRRIGFVKKCPTTNRWYIVPDPVARTNIAQAFRDVLSDRYSSSKLNKKIRREKREGQGRSPPTLPIFSFEETGTMPTAVASSSSSIRQSQGRHHPTGLEILAEVRQSMTHFENQDQIQFQSQQWSLPPSSPTSLDAYYAHVQQEDWNQGPQVCAGMGHRMDNAHAPVTPQMMTMGMGTGMNMNMMMNNGCPSTTNNSGMYFSPCSQAQAQAALAQVQAAKFQCENQRMVMLATRLPNSMPMSAMSVQMQMQVMPSGMQMDMTPPAHDARFEQQESEVAWSSGDPFEPLPLLDDDEGIMFNSDGIDQEEAFNPFLASEETSSSFLQQGSQ